MIQSCIRVGLPHSHSCHTLHLDDAPRTADDYERFTCAELPNRQQDPELYDIIVRRNLHGRIVNGRRTCMGLPCWDEQRQRCTRGYPQPFRQQPSTNHAGYPNYRRRSTAQGGDDLNAWVVAYNPYFSRRYDAHINVVSVSRGYHYVIAR